MNSKYYTKESNAQIVLSLLKQKGIKKVVASPGTTNMAVIGSMMNDPFFQIFSAPDERSAAYMACGMAAESGEVVVLSCTGATASRNYLPGLTEAFYRKIPIIAITSSQDNSRSGHLFPQFVDRTSQLKDIVKLSVQIPIIDSPDKEWECTVKVNNALLESVRNGGGPIHINLITQGEFSDFSEKTLPTVRQINRYSNIDELPVMPSGKIGIFIGSHLPFNKRTTEAIEKFCESYDALIFCDHTSGYNGKYKLLYSIAASQPFFDENVRLDLLIHIGEVSGDYYSLMRLAPAKVWRVSKDGELRDYFKKLTIIFQMEEFEFFERYLKKKSHPNTSNYEKADKLIKEIYSNIPQLPFSNIWIASVLASKIPEGSIIHFGILNSLRAWNFFPLPNSVHSYCNVGGFGIDGGLSTLIGASLVYPDKLYFGVIGDLAFFYDMNSLGNRHVGHNVRILMINNGKGTEFRNYSHPAHVFEERADDFIAAAGHYGSKSPFLVKHYAEDLGFKYLTASNKNELLSISDEFLDISYKEKPIIMEVFTNNEDESEALKVLRGTFQDKLYVLGRSISNTVKEVIGEDALSSVKRIIKH